MNYFYFESVRNFCAPAKSPFQTRRARRMSQCLMSWIRFHLNSSNACWLFHNIFSKIRMLAIGCSLLTIAIDCYKPFLKISLARASWTHSQNEAREKKIGFACGWLLFFFACFLQNSLTNWQLIKYNSKLYDFQMLSTMMYLRVLLPLYSFNN